VSSFASAGAAVRGVAAIGAAPPQQVLHLIPLIPKPTATTAVMTAST
jgi:hypothetical protein